MSEVRSHYPKTKNITFGKMKQGRMSQKKTEFGGRPSPPPLKSREIFNIFLYDESTRKCVMCFFFNLKVIKPVFICTCWVAAGKISSCIQTGFVKRQQNHIRRYEKCVYQKSHPCYCYKPGKKTNHLPP